MVMGAFSFNNTKRRIYVLDISDRNHYGCIPHQPRSYVCTASINLHHVQGRNGGDRTSFRDVRMALVQETSMNRPLTIMEELLNRLNDDLKEAWEERSAIMEFDGGLSHDHAECLALLNIFMRQPMALSGLSLLKAELKGDTYFIVTTDAHATFQHLSSIGCNITELTDLAEVLDSEFGGSASLAKIAILYEGKRSDS
jgi:hypothetical protein